MMEQSIVLLQDQTRAEKSILHIIREMKRSLSADQHAENGQNHATGRSIMGTLYERALYALLRKVRGYVFREVKTTYEYDTTGEKKVKNEVVTRKRQGPDLAAIIFVLTNVDPQHWRAKGYTEQNSITDSVTSPDLSTFTDPELQELAGWGDIQNEDE